jgi:hypothetical protein
MQSCNFRLCPGAAHRPWSRHRKSPRLMRLFNLNGHAAARWLGLKTALRWPPGSSATVLRSVPQIHEVPNQNDIRTTSTWGTGHGPAQGWSLSRLSRCIRTHEWRLPRTRPGLLVANSTRDRASLRITMSEVKKLTLLTTLRFALART